MITQELIDYVKTQLSAGISREQITSDLLGQGGWTTEQIDESFASISGVPVSLNDDLGSGIRENKYWSKWIPRTNKVFLYVTLFTLLIIHPIIIVTDALGLGLEIMLPFYGFMFIPFLVLLSFYREENRKLSEQFKYSESKLDVWFGVLVLVRNAVIILNIIPGIQLLGIMALVFGIIPYVIVYKLMQRSRNKSVAVV